MKNLKNLLKTLFIGCLISVTLLSNNVLASPTTITTNTSTTRDTTKIKPARYMYGIVTSVKDDYIYISTSPDADDLSGWAIDSKEFYFEMYDRVVIVYDDLNNDDIYDDILIDVIPLYQ